MSGAMSPMAAPDKVHRGQIGRIPKLNESYQSGMSNVGAWRADPWTLD